LYNVKLLVCTKDALTAGVKKAADNAISSVYFDEDNG